MRIIIAFLICILLSINAYALDINADEGILCQNIIKSLQEEPNKWFITSSELVYVENKKYINDVKKRLYPKTSNKATFVLGYHFSWTSNYISIKKPNMGFMSNNKAEEILLTEIKRFLYQSLHKEFKNSLPQSLPLEKPEQIGSNEDKKDSPRKL
jgi:hypothetical protein